MLATEVAMADSAWPMIRAADANCDIDALVGQIHETVREGNMRSQMLVLVRKPQHQRPDAQPAKGCRRIHPQAPDGFAALCREHRFGLFQISQHTYASPIERCSCVRQGQATRCALEKPSAKPVFETGHTLADGGTGQV